MTEKEALLRDMSVWMRNIPDTVVLSHISLPGTHNSCALYGSFGPIALAVCQVWPLDIQLNTGVRLLDIRCRRDVAGLLPIYHGPCAQYTNLQETLVTCSAFLLANPSETLVIRMQTDEWEAEACAVSSDEAFDTLCAPYRAQIASDVLPTTELRVLRGKMVLFHTTPHKNWILSWAQVQSEDMWYLPGLTFKNALRLKRISIERGVRSFSVMRRLLPVSKARFQATFFSAVSLSGPSSTHKALRMELPRLSANYQELGWCLFDFINRNTVHTVVSSNPWVRGTTVVEVL